MNVLYYHPIIRGLLALWLLFICLSLVWISMQLWQQRRYKPFFLALCFFACCDVYWQYLNANSYYVDVYKPMYKIDLCPIWPIIVINAVLTVVVASIAIHVFKWQRNHISAVSVKESFDTLPTGVCFYENGGRVYLVNEAMDKLTQIFAGQHLYNGERLWKILKSKSIPIADEDRAVVEADEKTYSFSRYKNNVNGQELYEIIASDTTDEAAQNKQLERKNEDLERLNKMLDEYNKNLADIVREREILQSKTKIHDDMNVLLISTINSIENYDTAESQRVSKLWNSNIIELQKDTEPYRKNPIETLRNLAYSLGVTLEFSGVAPEKNEYVRLLIAAVSECITNAIRHAGAKTITVTADENIVVITNDGKPPKAEITEGGGLTNLRNRAERLNADITIQSQPEFMLTLKYKKD